MLQTKTPPHKGGVFAFPLFHCPSSRSARRVAHSRHRNKLRNRGAVGNELTLCHQRCGCTLDIIKRCKERQGQLSDLTAVVCVHLEELASCMGCASNFVDALKERSLVTAVVITHQLAAPAVQERTGMLTGTAAGEVVNPPAPRLSLYQSCALRWTRHSQAPTRNSR